MTALQGKYLFLLTVNKDLLLRKLIMQQQWPHCQKCKDSARDNFCVVHKVEDDNHWTITNSFP